MIPSVRKALLALANEKNAEFVARLAPNLRRETVIGAYTQPLRNLAKSLYGTPDADAFLRDTPHELFEENQLQAFLICCVKDFSCRTVITLQADLRAASKKSSASCLILTTGRPVTSSRRPYSESITRHFCRMR